MSKIGPLLDVSKLNKEAEQLPEYIVVHNVLTSNECLGAWNYGKNKGNYSPGLISNKGNLQKGIRQTDLWWFRHNALKEKLENIIFDVNKKNWNFVLDQCEFFQLGEYKKGGHYSWHKDNSYLRNSSDRKLSFSLILNDKQDWQGGKLQVFSKLSREGKPLIKTIDKINNKGSIVIFPSSTFHRVTPITKGTRVSLVGWVWGPCLT